jgi:hypothetical protein
MTQEKLAGMDEIIHQDLNLKKHDEMLVKKTVHEFKKNPQMFVKYPDCRDALLNAF